MNILKAAEFMQGVLELKSWKVATPKHGGFSVKDESGKCVAMHIPDENTARFISSVPELLRCVLAACAQSQENRMCTGDLCHKCAKYSALKKAGGEDFLQVAMRKESEAE